MNNASVRIAGLVVAMFPFACVAIGGGRTDSSAGGAEATGGASASTTAAVGGAVSNTNTSAGGAMYVAGGTTGTTTTSTVPTGTPPSSTTDYGVTHPSPYPCTANTTAVYDEPPLPDAKAGCRDIYNSNQSYPPGTTRTIVAPTAPNGASCVAIDCWCSESKFWEPSASNLCR